MSLVPIFTLTTCGGFKLHKWISKDPKILYSIRDVNATPAEVLDLGKNENTRTLGLLWDPIKVYFKYKIRKNSPGRLRKTKRNILSQIAQIFDPLGLLRPVIIRAKTILQEIWEAGLGWDEVLPNHIHTSWCKFADGLTYLNDIKIPRHISLKNPESFQIHGFSDASTNAYGACVYLRAVDSDENVLIRLICAKSKVAPLKKGTVPRLELMGALLLTELVIKVKSLLKINVSREIYWTDSSVVLGWLSTSPSQLQIFVGNRVAGITEQSKISDVKYVRSSDNPADPVSRGVRGCELAGLELYWVGPRWLKENENMWPVRDFRNEYLPEIKKKVFSIAVALGDHFVQFSKFSSLNRLQRTTAYIFGNSRNSNI
ncbi:uncharacterized protein [Onthophagus taurus]|uniref:uncharacterized protein n=1 Tax=Onthophagus taurus TaxID=166361 RepID=UPI0039BEC6B5